MFKLYICIPDDMIKKQVEDVAKEIYLKDKSFKYSIVRAKYGKCKYLMVVKCPDKDIAYRRGSWFVHNVSNMLWYWVKEV